MTRLALLLVVLAACPKGGDKSKPTEPVGSGSSALPVSGTHDAAVAGPVTLPAAPPLPTPPISLPPPPENPRVTAEAVAFGELLFADPRLSPAGDRACTTCHVPERGYSGDVMVAADGKPNARRAPTLVNLAWVKDLGWDGRAHSVAELLPAHIQGQLDAVDASAARIAAVPAYAAHIARLGGTPGEAIVQALEAYTLTRYEADAPWDVQERHAVKGGVDPAVAGYVLFTGKAQCAQCHTPPLYTDNGFHRVMADTVGDVGRGRIEADKQGAFRTPTLRGASKRGAYFHAGNKKSLDDVIAYYQSPAAAALDPALARIKLTADEARQLARFLELLTATRPAPQKPVLP